MKKLRNLDKGRGSWSTLMFLYVVLIGRPRNLREVISRVTPCLNKRSNVLYYNDSIVPLHVATQYSVVAQQVTLIIFEVKVKSKYKNYRWKKDGKKVKKLSRFFS